MALTFNRHYTHAYVNSLFKSEKSSDDPVLNEAQEAEYVWLPLRLPLAEMVTAFEVDDWESAHSGTQVYLNSGQAFFVYESRKELEEAQDIILDKSLFMEEPGYKLLSNDSTKG